jgi:hypothetical protein
MTLRSLAAAAAAITLLAGCSGDAHKATPPQQAAGRPSVNCDDPTLNRALYPQCPPLEGPASQAHRWPNGLTVQVVRLEKLDPKLASELKPSQTLVRLTLSFTNGGTAAVPLQKDRFLWHSWAVPDDQLGSLAVRVDLAGDVVPWVFTDAQALLKG